MQLSFEAQLILFGAAIGLASSLITSFATALFQNWLNQKEYGIRRRWEREEELNKIHIPSHEDFERMLQGLDSSLSGKVKRLNAPEEFRKIQDKIQIAREELLRLSFDKDFNVSSILQEISEIEKIWGKRYTIFVLKPFHIPVIIGILVFMSFLAVVLRRLII